MFDLDDTLYAECDFVRSGFRAVATIVERESKLPAYDALIELHQARHPDPFEALRERFGLIISKSAMIEIYRSHVPDLTLAAEVRELLSELKRTDHPLGLLTDGRSITQRNKIQALGLDTWIEAIVISEEFGSAKPAERNFRYFEALFPERRCVYVGDNLNKDFVTPNRLGWLTVGVRDQGTNIHGQAMTNRVPADLPQFWIDRLA